jgi:hypothetical protein
LGFAGYMNPKKKIKIKIKKEGMHQLIDGALFALK